MAYNYNKYKNLPRSVQAIRRNIDLSEELNRESEGRSRIRDKENIDRIKELLESDYVFVEIIEGDNKSIIRLEKDGQAEEISLFYKINIEKLKKQIDL